jgi:RHH-type transcriptional regulator, proline utilization regulon repressor / proline dehydrogenase / delta 1-pyrroline-5-carboxylate dehydrogenase
MGLPEASLSTDDPRQRIRAAYLADEAETVERSLERLHLDPAAREATSARAADLVRRIRSQSKPGMMENFLAEYGLSTQEGVALMCLAEAMLRVPDPLTLDALIHDKITPSDWGRHLGKSSSSLVNASTWALMLTGRVLDTRQDSGLVGNIRGVVRRLGEPVVRTAVGRAMKILGRQFVLGRNINEALNQAKTLESQGYTYSYDMLGEAARTAADAERYHQAYAKAIDAIAQRALHDDMRRNPGISVKLSALYPRYEYGQRDRAVPELVERTGELARRAKAGGMGFNIDAEEADRLDLSLDIIDALLSDPALADWDGFGIVVQAFSRRALPVLDWLGETTARRGRRVMVRLVKGAYWDAEIKRAHVLGLPSFPVFTRKVNTDIAYMAGARRLFELSDRIYPQFATHNAHTAAAVLHLADETGVGRDRFEFQRLHGMGEGLHEQLLKNDGTHCRIYAPVGEHEDLLAYLVRRLLENGANSSFVNQIVDERITPEQIALDPIRALQSLRALGAPVANPVITPPPLLYAPDRRTAKGWDVTDPATMAELDPARERFQATEWRSGPLLADKPQEGAAQAGEAESRYNPARPDDLVGTVVKATAEQVESAVAAARAAYPAWNARPLEDRAACLERLADLYERHAPELFALMAREAGKILIDCVAEVREAVDFCRYYAAQARHLQQEQPGQGRGVFVCISPWNFPLAIFTGQITAALVTGNAVLAKPAEQTPLTAARAVAMMHEAGIPRGVIQLLPGDGPTVGARLSGHPGIDGICFTGSTDTARMIHRSLAENGPPDAPFIAETGGLNAMIVDSTALPEQAVRDVIASSFQSAGQRCSALRMLYVQNDVVDRTLEMLKGAMETLRVGDPWLDSIDVGPVIDREAKEGIDDYCRKMEDQGRLIMKLSVPKDGLFVAPTAYRVAGIQELEREVFGPVLHVATFKADEMREVIDAINAAGYGLTFGLHTRIDERVQEVVEHARFGNVYVNRNQIGAVVGTQPFGGEGLSGTGPKAGGPLYLHRFRRRDDEPAVVGGDVAGGAAVGLRALQQALDSLDATLWSKQTARSDTLRRALGELDGAQEALAPAWEAEMEPVDLPGPTGESNRLWFFPRGRALCLGELGSAEAAAAALRQAIPALALGNVALIVAPGASELVRPLQAQGVPIGALDGTADPDALRSLEGVAVIAVRGGEAQVRPLRRALAARTGEILPLVSSLRDPHMYLLERTVCVDTTAAGGNATLLAAADAESALL